MNAIISKSWPMVFLICTHWANVSIADEAACHAAPTRDCVLLMGVDRAIAQENPNRMTTGLLQVAALEQTYDPAQSRQTFDLMMTLLEDREPDPYERVQVLGRRSLGSGSPWRDLPIRHMIIAEINLLSAQLHGEELEKTHELIWKQTQYTGDEKAMRASLSASALDVPEEDVMQFLGFYAIVNSDNVQLADIVARISDERARNALYEAGAIYFAGQENAWVAASYADVIEDPNVRAQTLLQIAILLGEAGLVDEVRGLMSRPDFPTIAVSPRYGRPLAYLHAYLGDLKAVDKHLQLEEGRWSGARYVYNAHPETLRNLAALLSGDYQTFVTAAILARDSNARRRMFQFEDSVYRQLGPARMAVFLDHLSPELLIYALEGFGPYQAKTDDLAGALESLARLRAMRVEPRFSSHLERTLAAALARDGQYQAALAQAGEFDTAYQYVSIAKEIHASTNP